MLGKAVNEIVVHIPKYKYYAHSDPSDASKVIPNRPALILMRHCYHFEPFVRIVGHLIHLKF